VYWPAWSNLPVQPEPLALPTARRFRHPELVVAEPSLSDEPAVIALVSLESLHGYVPESYVGAVLATGSSAFEAVEALEQRALHLARETRAHPAPTRQDGSTAHLYAVLGLRFAAGITASVLSR
jgi:hypothetical protein